MSAAAIIVAAGTGKRYNSSTPKQFLKLNGKPVFLWSVLVFKKIKEFKQIVLVLPETKISSFASYSKKYKIDLVPGGAHRFNSVKNGLSKISDDIKYIAIHDAARPLIDKKIVLQSLAAVKKFGAAVVAVPAKDTVKKANNSLTIDKTIDRSTVWLAQTPQVFKKIMLDKVYSKKIGPCVTDDSQLAEKAGYKVKIVPGNYRNIKITYPQDLKTAEFLLKTI